MLGAVSYPMTGFSHKFAILVFAAALAGISPAQSDDFATLRRKAEAGDAKAQFDLASAYSQGIGVAKDKAQGVQWLKRSALEGYPGAQVVLGYMYHKGIEMEKDPAEAARCYKKAARQGSKDPKHAQTAQTHLSEMLSEGLISAREADWHAADPAASTKISGAKQSAKPAAFSFAEVETGLKGGITTKRMATLISTYGVDFTLNDTSRKTLADEGADEALLQTIASAKSPALN
jgi:hypothetical protein